MIEKMVFRLKKFTERVNRSGLEIKDAMEEVRMAREKKDRKRVGAALRKLKRKAQMFKRMTANFRRGMNRVRVMGRLSHRVEGFVAKNRDRFDKEELAVINSSLSVISIKRSELKGIIRQTVRSIKGIYKELRGFRKEMRKVRGF